jgi:hypothetical protein
MMIIEEVFIMISGFSLVTLCYYMFYKNIKNKKKKKKKKKK